MKRRAAVSRVAAIVLACATASAAPVARGAPDVRADREIQALLAFVAGSPCLFVRGGVEYPGPDARDHLARKLEVSRPMIGSADAFVDYVASASSASGEPYLVRCGGRESRARDWLREELARLRRTGRPQ